MPQSSETTASTAGDPTPENQPPTMDSKYRMIIVAAQRSKQIQRGARPRVEMDSQRGISRRVSPWKKYNAAKLISKSLSVIERQRPAVAHPVRRSLTQTSDPLTS